MKKLLLIPLAALLLTACGGTDDLAAAEDADEAADVTSAESALTSSLSDELAQPQSATPEDLATDAATRVGMNLQPEGCLTTTVTGNTVKYVFDDCSGPYGLVHVTGTVTAVYGWGQGGVVKVTLTGSGVKVNQATLDLAATVSASQAGSVKRAEVTTSADGTGKRGVTVHREGSYTITFDQATNCVTVDGAWSTAAARGATTTVSGYARCQGQCPKAGGTIVHTTVRDVTITLTYDGSASAAWSTSGGKSGTVALQCTPAS